MFQLIYGSAATKYFSHEELKALLLKARLNNTKIEITGMMLYHAGSFLQILEGEEQDVEQLFSKIGKDKFHTNIKIIYRGDIDEREFSDWSMGFVNTANYADLPAGFIDYVKDLSIHTIDKTRAKRVLKMFQEGTWRQKVDH